jgi:hypothetical protein
MNDDESGSVPDFPELVEWRFGFMQPRRVGRNG